jgi:integrase
VGGDSLRSGFVTEAFRAGAHSIMRQTGHRDPKMLEVYARQFAPLVGNAVLKLDL